MAMTRIRDLLAASPLPRLEARMLLEHVLQRPRAWLLAHDDAPLDAAALAAYVALSARRTDGEPMAYVLGAREFMGHAFRVTPDVLIPRPETEHLVEAALVHITAHIAACPDSHPEVVDLGTGSGAIAVSVALACPHARVTASDASYAALAVARDNAERLGAAITFCQGDWYAALPADQRYDLILANPPYIARHDPHLGEGDVRFEPRAALTDNADGLAALRTLAAGAPARLKPGGVIWLEHGCDQAAGVRALLLDAGLRNVASHRDLAGIERISGGYL